MIVPGRPQLRVAQYQRHRCICHTAMPEDVSAMPEETPAEAPEPPGNPLFSAQFQEALKGKLRGFWAALRKCCPPDQIDVHDECM